MATKKTISSGRNTTAITNPKTKSMNSDANTRYAGSASSSTKASSGKSAGAAKLVPARFDGKTPKTIKTVEKVGGANSIKVPAKNAKSGSSSIGKAIGQAKTSGKSGITSSAKKPAISSSTRKLSISSAAKTAGRSAISSQAKTAGNTAVSSMAHASAKKNAGKSVLMQNAASKANTAHTVHAKGKTNSAAKTAPLSNRTSSVKTVGRTIPTAPAAHKSPIKPDGRKMSSSSSINNSLKTIKSAPKSKGTSMVKASGNNQNNTKLAPKSNAKSPIKSAGKTIANSVAVAGKTSINAAKSAAKTSVNAIKAAGKTIASSAKVAGKTIASNAKSAGKTSINAMKAASINAIKSSGNIGTKSSVNTGTKLAGNNQSKSAGKAAKIAAGKTNNSVVSSGKTPHNLASGKKSSFVSIQESTNSSKNWKNSSSPAKKALSFEKKAGSSSFGHKANNSQYKNPPAGSFGRSSNAIKTTPKSSSKEISAKPASGSSAPAAPSKSKQAQKSAKSSEPSHAGMNLGTMQKNSVSSPSKSAASIVASAASMSAGKKINDNIYAKPQNKAASGTNGYNNQIKAANGNNNQNKMTQPNQQTKPQNQFQNTGGKKMEAASDNVVLSDMDIISDVLSGQKALIKLYGTALCETDCPQLRSIISNQLTEAANDQFDAFLYMNQRGMYPTEQAQQPKVNKAKQKASQQQKQIKN